MRGDERDQRVARDDVRRGLRVLVGGPLNVSPAEKTRDPAASSSASASTVFCAPSLKPTTPIAPTPGCAARYRPAASTSSDSFQPNVCSQSG